MAIYQFPAFSETGLSIHLGQIFWYAVNPQQRGCNPNANGRNERNWPGEENPLIANGGPQAHLPRFYVKKRVTGRNPTGGDFSGTIQYIATRHPLVLNFDDEAGILDEPTDPNDPQGPIIESGRPDRFKGEIASIFCEEKMGDVGNTRTDAPWKNCRVVELLVGLCLRDETPRKLPGLQPPDYHSNIRLVNQAFPEIRTVFQGYQIGQGQIIINEDTRLQARAMVMNSPLCPRFARIALRIGRQDGAGRPSLDNMREWRKHLQAAREQGYVMALVLIPCGVEYRWNIYRVQHLENLGAPAGKGALRDIMTQSILPDDFTYWYFCCAQAGPNCN